MSNGNSISSSNRRNSSANRSQTPVKLTDDRGVPTNKNDRNISETEGKSYVAENESTFGDLAGITLKPNTLSGREISEQDTNSYTSSAPDEEDSTSVVDRKDISNIAIKDDDVSKMVPYSGDSTSEIDENAEQKNIPFFKRISDAIFRKASLKNILIIGVPATLAILGTALTGIGTILIIAAVGISLIAYVSSLFITALSKPNDEELSTPEYAESKKNLEDIAIKADTKNKKLYDEMIKLKEITKLNEDSPTDNITKPTELKKIRKELDAEEIKKERGELQDPSKLSRWQRIKRGLKISAPIVLSVIVTLVGVGGSILLLGTPIGLGIGCMLFGLTAIMIASRGVAEYFKQKEDDQAFYDSLDNKVDADISSITSGARTDDPDDPDDPDDTDDTDDTDQMLKAIDEGTDPDTLDPRLELHPSKALDQQNVDSKSQLDDDSDFIHIDNIDPTEIEYEDED